MTFGKEILKYSTVPLLYCNYIIKQLAFHAEKCTHAVHLGGCLTFKNAHF